MSFLYLDTETASERDLTVVGVHNYAQNPTTKLLMAAYAFGDEPVKLWQPHAENFPDDLCKLLKSDCQIVSWNSTFERLIFKHVLNIDLPASRFVDPMVISRYLSMPGSLEAVGEILGLPQDLAKIADGERLIKKFCEPSHPGGEMTLFGISESVFRTHETDPEDWAKFCEYCRNDVIAEREIMKLLAKRSLPEIERAGWLLDQDINDRGLPTDKLLVDNAIWIAKKEKESLIGQMKELTGVDNPNSRDQLLAWAQTQGYPYNSMKKLFATLAQDDIGVSEACSQALLLRREAAKTSDKKFTTLTEMVSEDGFLRDQFSYLGAARSGRWSGHGVQVHNLPRPTKEVEGKMDLAVELMRKGDYDAIKANFSSVMDVVSSCTRAAIRAPEGYQLVVCDLNAIEYRVLGFLSGCDHIYGIFRADLCPYKTFAVDLFGKKYTEITKDERNGAKPGVLGAGYRLSGGEEEINEDGDSVKSGLWGYAQSLGVEISRDLAHRSVSIFRTKHKEVKSLWFQYEDAVKTVVQTKKQVTVGPISFDFYGKTLRIELPSGRYLHYINPKIESRERDGRNGKYTQDNLTYDGSYMKKWTRIPTHGGKLVENVDQAVSRDLLLHGMQTATGYGLTVIGHVHDEIICLAREKDLGPLNKLRAAMVTVPNWAKDLPLGAEGFVTKYYKKG